MKVGFYAERARRPDNDKHLRLSDLATALAAANGHANFRDGDLREFLDVRDDRTVDAAIVTAVKQGLLASGSSRRCLQLPWGIDGYCLRMGPGRDTLQEMPCRVCVPDARPQRPATCHPDRPHYAKGLCGACYKRKQRQ